MLNLNLITNLFSLFTRGRYEEIKKLRTNPVPAQETTFKDLIKKMRQTSFGQDYGLSEVETVAQFQWQVPLSHYEDLHSYIERMMNGEADVLWPGRVQNFSKSSGTTDRSKFLPVSTELLDSCFQMGRDQLVCYLNQNKDSKMLEGKTIFVGGSLAPVEPDSDLRVGDVSAILMENMPMLGKYSMGAPLEKLTLPDFEVKLEELAEETMNKNITSISGTPTWTIALINKVLEKSGKASILEVWPNLEMFFHGAVAFTPYREVFHKLIPSPQMHYMEAYNASEGFFAFQDDLSKPGELLLMPDCGVFYEFIPMNEFGQPGAQALHMGQVETGVNYALIISTNAGLMRYVLGDTVEFTSLCPHRIRITGRTKHFINAFGEEVMVHNTDRAIEQAASDTGASITEYTACPMYMDEEHSGCHEWVVEFSHPPADVEEFSRVLDQQLRKLNSDYDAKRHKDIILKNLVLHSVPPGTFYSWMKSRGKLGGQHKVPRLSNSREYVEGVMSFV